MVYPFFFPTYEVRNEDTLTLSFLFDIARDIRNVGQPRNYNYGGDSRDGYYRGGGAGGGGGGGMQQPKPKGGQWPKVSNNLEKKRMTDYLSFLAVSNERSI